MPPQQPTSKFVIEVNGSPLSEAVDKTLVSVFVDDSLNLPDMFQLTFRDPARTAIADGGFKMGALIGVRVFSDAVPGGEKLITGEITALEAEFDPGGTMTVIRGFDPSHRLFRGRITETYTNVTYSDVATKVARRAGLTIGKVDPATTVHKHVSQGNVTDWQFLKGMAAEIGYEVGCFDGKFEFRKPTRSTEGPQAGTLSTDDPLQLVLGTTLLRFRTTITSAEQVKEVNVRGWDMRQKKALVGTAPAETLTAAVGVKPTDLAAVFGNPSYIGVSTPYVTQAEVDGAAKALAEQIAGAFAEFEGVARGNPKLRAGKAVSLGLVAQPFDGRYTLTTTRHVYDPKDGYTVWFTVSGRQERSLLGLTSGGAGGNGSAGPPIYGVAAALVTDVKDPDDLGRVKLKFPWLSDSYTTDWARLVQLGAGKARGSVMLPEVNDEVLVAFEQGDIRRPYVIGGLFNGVDKPTLGNGLVDGSTGAVKRRGFISKKGHKLVFLDDGAKSGVLLATADNGFRISLNETGTTIKVNSKGAVEIEAATKVSIQAKSNVEVRAQGQMKLQAGAGLTIDGGPSVEVKGGVIKLN
jgi:phage protein D